MAKGASAAIKKEIEGLRGKLRHHEHRYYVLDDPEISDAAYDRLMSQLKDLEAAYPELISADSPTVRVGGKPRTGFETVQHSRPMLSLDNSYSYDDLREFDRRAREACEHRLRRVEYGGVARALAVPWQPDFADGANRVALARDHLEHVARVIFTMFKSLGMKS